MMRSLLVCIVVTSIAVGCNGSSEQKAESSEQRAESSEQRAASSEQRAASSDSLFVPPDTSTIPKNAAGDLIRYGRELLANFPYYLGPKGKVGKYGGNGLSCQNCHLEAGTRPYGLNYFSAHARYPQYRAREGKVLTLADRVNNCVERPLNGKPLPLDSKEMVAIVTYMQWLGKGVPVGGNVPGDKLKGVKFPDRAADPAKGQVVYEQHCMRCHGDEGQGVLKPDGIAYVYPPLWGMQSYQPGSSMHRVIKAAQFIKYNMPQDLARWDKPVLTDEEAFDVAAYINDDKLHDRPKPYLVNEYPDRSEKPVDYFYPPYADVFTQEQHKYGPFKPIIEWRKKNGQTTGY
jgi:thiosulfate dehydrogenase